MFCEECGQKIDDDAKVCPYCGTSVYEEYGWGNESEGDKDIEEPEGDKDINELDDDKKNKKNSKKSGGKKKSKAVLIWVLVILLVAVLLGGLYFLFFSPWNISGAGTSKAQQQVLEKVQATIEYNENADEMEYERTVVNCIMEQISVKTISDSDVEAVLEIKYPDAAALLRELIENNADCANKSELYQLMRDELNNGKAEIVKTRVTVEYDDSESIVMDEELVNILSGGLYTVDSEMEEQP